MKKSIIAIVIMLLISHVSLAAGDKNEFSLQGSVDSSDSSGSNTTTYFIMGNYGKYLSPVLVARGTAMYLGSDNSFTMLEVGGGVKYYLGQSAKSKWVPFVFGDVDLVSIDISGFGSGSGFGLDAGVGAANFITEQVSFDLTAMFYTNSVDVGAGSSTTSGVRFNAGTTIRF